MNVSASLIRIYILASVMYALAGFLIGSKAGGASTATGFGYELEAIAACTIGGVSTTGGIGTVGGVLVGVLVLLVISAAAAFLSWLIPLKLPTVAYCSILGLLCACPISPISEIPASKIPNSASSFSCQTDKGTPI